MKRFHLGTIMVALAVLGCTGDPTAALRGGAVGFTITPTTAFPFAGAEPVRIEIVVRDAQLNPLAVPVTVTSSDEAVATVAADTLPEANGDRHVFFASPLTPGVAYLRVEAGGVRDSATLNVLPPNFGGALSSLTPAGGSELVISATAVLKFVPESVAVVFGGGYTGTVTSATADEITVLVPFSDPGTLTIDPIDVTYVTDLHVSLSTSGSVTQTGRFWSGDFEYATAPVIATPATAGEFTALITNFDGTNADPANTCAEIFFGFGSAGPCLIYKLVVPAGQTLGLDAELDWDSDADLDFYACDATGVGGCFEDGGSGATSNHPETFSFTFPEGTHYIVIESYDGAKPPNVYLRLTHQ